MFEESPLGIDMVYKQKMSQRFKILCTQKVEMLILLLYKMMFDASKRITLKLKKFKIGGYNYSMYNELKKKYQA